MAQPSLTILTHARQGLSPGHFLAAAAAHWSARSGGRVQLHQGEGAPPAADLAALHIDLTRVPEAYLALAAGFPRCLNAGAVDIAKRRVSRALLSPGDRHEGPVIVKTDRNFGGEPERRLAAAGRWRGLRDRLAARLPAWLTHRVGAGRYLVLPALSAVPDWVWRDPGLVVERFFVERHGERYAINMWFFLGDADCVSVSLADTPLVKAANTVVRLPLHDRVPEALRRRRAELGFDFGKFDYVMVAGEPQLLDANRTPHCGPAGFSARGQELCRRLGEGLERLVEAARA